MNFAGIVYWQQESVADPVVDNFDVEWALGNVRWLKATIDILTQQLFDLDAQERTEEWISEKYQEVRDEIVSVITTIQNTTEQIDTMMRRVAGYKRNIDNTAAIIRKLRREIDDIKKLIEEFAIFLYQTNNFIANPENGIIDEVKLLIHSDNIPHTLANQQLVWWLLVQFTTLLEKLSESEQQHIQAIIKLNELRMNTKHDIIVYGAELEKMQQKKVYLTQFIELYRNGSLQSNKINTVFQNPKAVHESIMNMVDDIAKKTYNVWFNIFDALKELEWLNTNIKMRHEIARPIYPIEKIIHFFDDSSFRDKEWYPHWWIQVAAAQWTPVYSVRDGIVYHVSDHDGIAINWILVLHTDGYISTYSYMNNIVVQPWDLIRRWQLLWYSGWEPWTKWAWFIAPGANLTFSLFKNGTPIDPLILADVSVVANRNILPDIYSIKHLRDKYARGVDVSNLPIIEGNSPDERAQRFLYTYGVWVYKTLWFWNNAIIDTNIDRDMVICVAFAESTLGKYLSTSNNIGNVGNNDRWDRFSFWSALAWARAIAQTLNNQFLWHYHTIDQLSRYGNPDGKIYASSPINRQSNVTKCLSQIKWYYVPEDFPFRTGVNPNWSADRIVSGGFDWQQVRRGTDQ